MVNISDIKYDLITHWYHNMIYYLTKDEYNEVKNMLNKDYGFLDVVLEFNDFDRLTLILKSIPQHSDRELIRRMIINEYLYYKILKTAKIKNYIYTYSDVCYAEDILYSDDYLKFLDSRRLDFETGVANILSLGTGLKKHKAARLHFLLDSVGDDDLQRAINNLFIYKSNIAMVGYTSKPLRIKYTMSGDILEMYHDYIEEVSNQKLMELRRIKNDKH